MLSYVYTQILLASDTASSLLKFTDLFSTEICFCAIVDVTYINENCAKK